MNTLLTPVPDCHAPASDLAAPVFDPAVLDNLLGPLASAPLAMPLVPFSGHRHRMAMCSVPPGRLDPLRQGVGPDYPWDAPGMGGCGAGATRAEAGLKAAAEALERCSTILHSEHQTTLAAASRLQGALDLSTVPRFSEAEIARSGGMLERADPDAPIRWFPGWSPSRRERTWLPLVMTHLPVETRPGERFWLPISTGTAAHADTGRAAAAAVAEAVERDVIATTWLARLPLPRIRLDAALSAEACGALAACFDQDAPALLFDGGAEFGLTTIYGLRRHGPDAEHATVVGCATHVDPVQACRKAVAEIAAVEVSLRHSRSEAPSDAFDCRHIDDGARFMALQERSRAFDFLTEGEERVTLSEMIGRAAPYAGWGHREIVAALATAGMDVVLADITTDDVRELGLCVVRAVVPGLMPYSCVTRARYLGTPRLAEVARRRGSPGFTEAEVNPFPQPFA